jgi:SagB-type dehydrogenase family enzyme
VITQVNRGRDSRTRYRRTPHLVCHWEKGQFILHNYATGRRAPATPLAVEILDLCEDWRAASDLEADLRALDRRLLATVLSALVEHTFLEQSGRPTPVSSAGYSQWEAGWRPAAAFFHASTKDVRFARADTVDALLRRKAVTDPPPAPLKPSTGRAIPLPVPAQVAGADLAHALRARRTWRQFMDADVSLQDMGTLLGLTWGVQEWMHIDGFGRMALKTSPSGGARHSIEVYAYVRRVKGLRRGWYHYDPDRHTLLARPPARRRKISDYLPTQPWYDEAAVVLMMTAIFARVQWKYSFARAYRCILTEAGHLAQTCCLLATSLNLAPFCSMALADSLIEKDLGIDGVSESVIYAAGVGQRPPKMDWAPWPKTRRTPKIEVPVWKRGESSERPGAPRSSADRAVRKAAPSRPTRRG